MFHDFYKTEKFICPPMGRCSSVFLRNSKNKIKNRFPGKLECFAAPIKGRNSSIFTYWKLSRSVILFFRGYHIMGAGSHSYCSKKWEKNQAKRPLSQQKSPFFLLPTVFPSLEKIFPAYLGLTNMAKQQRAKNLEKHRDKQPGEDSSSRLWEGHQNERRGARRRGEREGIPCKQLVL